MIAPATDLKTTARTAEGNWEARPGPSVKDWDFWAVMPTLTDRAVTWIHQQDVEQPFFLYFPFTSPHAPIVPTKEFKGKSKATTTFVAQEKETLDDEDHASALDCSQRPLTEQLARVGVRHFELDVYRDIVSLVHDGFLVRTRADRNTTEARTNDGRRRDQAITSGARLISTDFPEPNLRLSDDRVALPPLSE